MTHILVYDGPNGVSGVIEAVINQELRQPLANNDDPDDVRQEMRLAAIRAMPKFDPTKIGPSPFRFFQQCIRNHIYNLHRGVHVPNNPPCARCELWDSTNKICKIDEVGCEAIVKYRKNMQTKAAIRRPEHLPEFHLSRNENSQNRFLLHESLQQIMPDNLLYSYNMMASGLSKQVDSKSRSKIRKIVREYLDGT